MQELGIPTARQPSGTEWTPVHKEAQAGSDHLRLRHELARRGLAV
jgi:hypothetical protein